MMRGARVSAHEPSSTSPLPARETLSFIQRRWTEDVLPALTRYIEIPAKSPSFDREWAAHGHLDRAAALIEEWSRRRPIEGLTVETVRLPGRTPVILMEVPGTSPETVLLYGHCDKQPEMTGWAEGLGPWIPVRRGDRLYGRGAQDDGYAAFCALTAIEAVQQARAPHARLVVLIEASEESGSPDLPAYMEAFAARIGEPDLVICLDSGCGNYEQLWGTTSLRGVINGVLTVEVLSEGVHSGAASGIVPSSFRIARQLLSRIEDERTGALVRDFHVEVPPARAAEARAVAGVLTGEAAERFPVVKGMSYAQDDPVSLLLANTWEPALGHHGRRRPPHARKMAATCFAPSRPSSSPSASRPRSTRPGRRGGSRSCWKPIRPMGRACATRAPIPRRAGTHRPPSRGWSKRCSPPPSVISASPPCSRDWAAPFPSWPCWASDSPGRSSSSRARAAPGRMPMAPTSSCTCRTRSG